jgi:NADH:ubiquinone reductase (non-electrogenic)
MAPNMRPFAAANLVSQVGRRAFTTQRPSLIASRAQWTPRPIQHQIALRQSVRRAATDAKPPKPKRRFRLLRWTWRLTQLTLIGGLAYVGHGIYEVRNPHDQPEPHPSKKTLVVLGMSTCGGTDSMAGD